MLECGRATTRQERAAVLAQRFPVYPRRGYYREGRRTDHDHWNRRASDFLPLFRDEDDGGVLLASARLIVGASVPAFRFPIEGNFAQEVPAPIQERPCGRAPRSAASWPRGPAAA